MGRLVCEECKKVYDFDVDDFCPRCGAFNQPKKTWGVDAQGNVVRVDGVNEVNHKGSFVHKEIHSEKTRRRVTGMDKDSAMKRQAQRPVRQPGSSVSGLSEKKKSGGSVFGTIIWIIVILNILRACMGIF